MSSSLITRPLTIAFTFDRRSDWLSAGASAEECLEFESDEAIENLAQALRTLGRVEMVGGVKELTKRLVGGEYKHWDLVFNICEGYKTIGREAQAPALLEAWGVPYALSDAATLVLCIDKAKTKMVLEHYGVPTSPFACIPPRNTWPTAPGFSPLEFISCSRHAEILQSYPLFIKRSSSSSGIGISEANKVHDEGELLAMITKLSNQVPDETLLVERFLSGREFTVGVIGTGRNAKVIGIREIVFLHDKPATLTTDFDPTLNHWDVYGYELKRTRDGLPLQTPRMSMLNIQEERTLFEEISGLVLNSWRLLGCRDLGRVDVRCDSQGRLNFIEVNAIPGLARGWSDLPCLAQDFGMEYEDLIREVVESALKRTRTA